MWKICYIGIGWRRAREKSIILQFGDGIRNMCQFWKRWHFGGRKIGKEGKRVWLMHTFESNKQHVEQIEFARKDKKIKLKATLSIFESMHVVSHSLHWDTRPPLLREPGFKIIIRHSFSNTFNRANTVRRIH